MTMFELFDRQTGNLLGEFADLPSALAAVREERDVNAPVDLSLGQVVAGHTRTVWAGERLDELLARGVPLPAPTSAASSSRTAPSPRRIQAPGIAYTKAIVTLFASAASPVRAVLGGLAEVRQLEGGTWK